MAITGTNANVKLFIFCLTHMSAGKTMKDVFNLIKKSSSLQDALETRYSIKLSLEG